jgi:hypothetical protein
MTTGLPDRLVVMTLTEFLLARIAEDEAEVANPDWAPSFLHSDRWMGHAATWSKGRTLAECEAKRRIVALHESWPVLVQKPAKIERDDGNLDSYVMRMSQEIAWATTREYVARFGVDPPTAPMLAILAAVYADHPSFQEAWRA